MKLETIGPRILVIFVCHSNDSLACVRTAPAAGGPSSGCAGGAAGAGGRRGGRGGRALGRWCFRARSRSCSAPSSRRAPRPDW